MFFARCRKFFLNLKSALVDHVDGLLAGVAFVWTAATTQSVFIGASLCILGLALLIWGNGYLIKDNGATNCFAGPYRFVRYPMVLCRCLIMMGLLIASRQPLLYCLSVLVLTPSYHRLSRSADEVIVRELGPVASQYRALVSGLIPQLLPAKILGVSGIAVGESFSWRRGMRARRWEATCVSLLVFFCLLGHYIWAARFFTELQWRSGAIALTGLAAFWILSFYNRRAKLLARSASGA